MSTKSLSSNVVNYLVWRYLQESGFGNAALHLSRCWMRDPETLPFAKNVEPHFLIRMLQDGMRYDQLLADECRSTPQYQFGNDHGQPYSERNGALLTLDQGIPAHELATEANGAVQEPPQKKGVKRPRKPKQPNGVEPRPEPEVNGDAMEIEQNGATHVTNSVRAESEPPASEVESPTVTDIPMSTLSIGHDAEIQTEIIADLAPNTIFIPQTKDIDKVVQHTSWGPSDSPMLLSAGQSILQMHMIEKEAPEGSAPSIRTANIHLPADKFAITALCWQSHGDLAISLREDSFSNAGDKIRIDRLIRLDDGGSNFHIISSSAGLVNTLRWNASKEMLLSISTSDMRGCIKIWQNDADSNPAWTEFTDTVIFDAQWISETEFVVCGAELFRIYSVRDVLDTQRTLDTRITWEEAKFDPTSGIIAALGIQGQTSYLGILHPNDPHDLRIHEYPDQFLTGLDLRIRAPTNALTNGSAHTSVWLATSSMSGVARIWDANEPFKSIKKLATTDDSHAFKIAFSPDGALLAAAGPDAVTIWDVEKREVPLASWRAKDWTKSKWDPSMNGEFSLGWDFDSSRILIALGNQIAVIPIAR